jgi:magnesium transporter
MISIYRWNKEAQAGEWLTAAAIGEGLDALRSADLLWVDLEGPTDVEERLVLEKLFPVHPLTLEDITRLRRDPSSLPHFPKVEEFADYLFVIVNPLTLSFLDAIKVSESAHAHPGGEATTQLSAILTDTMLITHHYQPVMSVHQLRSFLGRHAAQAGRGPDYLFHLILDDTVDQYVPALDHVDDALDELETAVFARPVRQMLQTMLRLKREIVMLRKTLVYEREVLARLARGEFALIDEREMVYYRNVYDHLVRFAELIESSREMVSDLLQTHLAATQTNLAVTQTDLATASHKLNEIMKVLTMISTVVLPMTLIAGIYGMNFEVQPEFKWRFGYSWALGLMVLTGIVSFLFFKWRKWI